MSLAKTVLTLCLVFLPRLVFPQALNHVYPQISNIRPALAYDDRHFYISGINNLDPSRLDYLKLDQQGRVVQNFRKQYNDSLSRMYNAHNGLLSKGSQLYSVLTNYVPPFPQDSAFIVINVLNKANLSLDSAIHFAVPGFKYSEAFAASWDQDSNLLITGSVRTYDIPNRHLLLLLKFDKDLKPLWYTTVNGTPAQGPAGPTGADIVVSDNGHILVTGNPYYYSAKKMTFSARFTPDGTKEYYREYFHPFGSWGMHCVDKGNGTYQYVLNSWTNSSGSNNQLHVGIMDTTGRLVSRDTIGLNNRAQAAMDLIQTSDENYYTSGAGYYGVEYCFGAKFSAQGDSLWYRSYRYQDTLDFHFPESFFEMPDSGIVHISTFVDLHNPDSVPHGFAWLYKTDEHGCLIENCHLQIEETQFLAWTFYPNPSSGEVQVELPQAGSISIINGLGQMVLEEQFPYEGSHRLDLSQLAEGCYTIRYSTWDIVDERIFILH